MAVVSLLSNPISLRVQRNLADSTEVVSTSLERLSSGLRLNHASDGPADIALSSRLNADTRVYTQAILNVSNAASMFNIGSSALSELSTILSRLSELATTAANGTTTATTRSSLNNEAVLLVSEYNRILMNTDFNGVEVIDGTLTRLTVQAGYSTAGKIDFLLPDTSGAGASTPATTSLTGTYSAIGTYLSFSGTQDLELVTGDIDEDGNLDIIGASLSGGNTVGIYYGNGDGSFNTGVSVGIAGSGNDVIVRDINGDTHLDLIYTDSLLEVSVKLGNGDGTFFAEQGYQTSSIGRSLALSDVNNDGVPDLVVTANGIAAFDVLLGNSNGSFSINTNFNMGGTSPVIPDSLGIANFNGGSNPDIVAASTESISLFYGNGDGTFNAQVTLLNGSFRGVSVGDVDGDGDSDIIAHSVTTGNLVVFLSNNDGTFNAGATYYVGPSGSSESELIDVNDDNILDIVSSNGNGAEGTTNILLGNSNGTFNARTSVATGLSASSNAVGDFNNDGYLDFAGARNTGIGVFLSNTTSSGGSSSSFLSSAQLTGIDLTTEGLAQTSLSTIEAASDAIYLKEAQYGAAESRLQSAYQFVQVTRDNYQIAHDQIVSVDVAQEAVRLVTYQIRQNSAAALLAQANQIPALALKLLG